MGDIDVSPAAITFPFDKDLQFRILAGKFVLTRDTSTDLITAYQEFWDQDIATVLKSSKFKV